MTIASVQPAIPPEAERIDARGLRCPWPALRAARAMREGAQAVAVIADDPAAPRELAALATAQGWAFAQGTAHEGPCFLMTRPAPATAAL